MSWFYRFTRLSTSTPNSTPLGNSIVQRNGNAVSPLSQYLVIPSASGSSSTNRKVPKAHLLTSDQCLAELKEKERNKKLAAEEKERKKKEREEKQKQKQELRITGKEEAKGGKSKKQAEEKLRKAEDKAKKTQEKAEARAKRQQAVSEIRATANKRALDSESTAVSEENTPLKRTRMASTRKESFGKSTRLLGLPRVTVEEDEIDPNVCCICFATFEEDTIRQTGAEWVPCACGRWLHEDCAEDIKVDSDGNERCCPFCVM